MEPQCSLHSARIAGDSPPSSKHWLPRCPARGRARRDSARHGPNGAACPHRRRGARAARPAARASQAAPAGRVPDGHAQCLGPVLRRGGRGHCGTPPPVASPGALHSCHRVPARRGGQGGCPPRGPTAPSALANGPTQAQVPTWPDRACLGEAASRAALTRMCQCRWCRHWPAPGLSIGWELVSKCGVALIGFQTVGRNGTHACNPSCWRQQCHAWHKRSHAPSLHRGPAGCIALTGLCAVGGGGEQGHREAKEPYDTEGHGHQHDEDEWLRGGEQ